MQAGELAVVGNQRIDSGHKGKAILYRFCTQISEKSKNPISSAGVEPTTFGFGGRRSIQLSYEDKIPMAIDLDPFVFVN